MFCNIFSFYGCELLPTFSQILDKKWIYIGALLGLCIHFSKSDHSVRKDVLYNVFVEFGIL
jgi:hypothetical protein